jgi:hypothetical protein
MKIVSTNQRTSNPPAQKKRVSTLDCRDLLFKEILSYLLVRNKYILSSGQRSIGVSMSKKESMSESNRMIDWCVYNTEIVPLVHSPQRFYQSLI